MNRRSILKALGFAPVGAAAMAKAAVDLAAHNASIHSWVNDELYPVPPAPANELAVSVPAYIVEARETLRTFSRDLAREDDDKTGILPVPPRIASMRSWSEGYKQEAAKRDRRERTELMHAIDSILYGEHNHDKLMAAVALVQKAVR